MKLHPNLPRLLVAFVALSGATSLPAQSLIQFSASTYDVTEGTSEVVIVVQRTNSLDTIVSVDFATLTNGTAAAGADYPQIFNFKQK